MAKDTLPKEKKERRKARYMVCSLEDGDLRPINTDISSFEDGLAFTKNGVAGKTYQIIRVLATVQVEEIKEKRATVTK